MSCALKSLALQLSFFCLFMGGNVGGTTSNGGAIIPGHNVVCGSMTGRIKGSTFGGVSPMILHELDGDDNIAGTVDGGSIVFNGIVGSDGIVAAIFDVMFEGDSILGGFFSLMDLHCVGLLWNTRWNCLQWRGSHHWHGS